MQRLRNYFRRTMNPMEPSEAQALKQKLAMLYAVLGWNIIGFTVYHLFYANVPKKPTDSVDYAKLLGVHDATVIQYSGFKKVNEYDIHLKKEEIEEFHNRQVNPEAAEPSK